MSRHGGDSPDVVSIVPDDAVTPRSSGGGPYDANESNVVASPRSGLLSNSVWSASSQLAPALSALLITPFTIHKLGLDRYGLYILSLGLLSFLGSFDGGLTASAGRYFSIYVGKQDARRAGQLLYTLTIAILGVGIIVAGAFSLLAPKVAELFSIPVAIRSDGVFLFRIMAFVVLLGLIRSVYASLLNAHGRFAWTSMTYLLSFLMFISATLLALTQGWGLKGLAWALLIQAASCAAMTLPAVRSHVTRDDMNFLPRAEIIEYVRFASQVQLIGLAGLVNVQIASLVVAKTLQISKVGVYNVGANLSTQLRVVPSNALRATGVHLGRAFGADGWSSDGTFTTLQRDWVRLMTGWFAVAMGSTYFGVIAWLGPQFSQAGFVAVVLLAGNYVVTCSGVLLIWLQVTGHPRVEATYSIWSVVGTLSLMAVLIGPFGIRGVAVGTAVTQCLASIYLVRRARGTLPVKPKAFIRDVPVLPGMICLGATVSLESFFRAQVPTGSLGLLVTGALAAPVLGGYLIYLFGRDKVLATLGRRRPKPPC